MIKYPVSFYYDGEVGGYTVCDSDHDILMHIEKQCIDFDANTTAKLVVNSLNAMNEFPRPRDNDKNNLVSTVKLVSWVKKYIFKE